MGTMRATTHNHVQSVASDTWTIVHNMGCNPAVDVAIHYNAALTKIIPMSIRIVDLNTTEIKFSSPQTGEARLV